MTTKMNSVTFCCSFYILSFTVYKAWFTMYHLIWGKGGWLFRRVRCFYFPLHILVWYSTLKTLKKKKHAAYKHYPLRDLLSSTWPLMSLPEERRIIHSAHSTPSISSFLFLACLTVCLFFNQPLLRCIQGCFSVLPNQYMWYYAGSYSWSREWHSF